MSANVEINAGACRFVTRIEAVCEDGMNVELKITSDCPFVSKLNNELKTVDIMNAVGSRFADNEILSKCGAILPHPACPIPCSLIKACEVSAGFAIKKEVTIKFS